MNSSGSAASCSSRNSSRLPWPVVCTPNWPLCTSLAPRRARALWSRDTAASLPGIGCDENTMVSSSPTVRNRWRPCAIWLSAARGSPWEPVQTTQVRAGSRPSRSSAVASIRSSMRSRPSWRARVTLRTIDGPSTTSVRPVPAAAAATCWMRCTWLEKAPTTIRRPSCSANTCSSTGPMADSDDDEPAESALVESASSRRMPGSPDNWRRRGRSVTRPSTGVGSSLKSLECRIRPWGVPKIVIRPWGVEWVTGRNSQSKGPIRRRSWSARVTSSGRGRPANSNFPATIPSVNADP